MKIKNKFLVLYSVLLVAMLFGVHFFNSMPLYYGMLGGVLLIIRQPIYIIPIYFISSLAGTFFVVPDGSGSISRYLFIFMTLSLIIKILRDNNWNKNSVFNGAFFLFLMSFNLISAVTSLSTSMDSFLLISQNLIILFLFSKITQIDINSLNLMLVVSAILTVLLILLELSLNGFNLGTIQMRLTINENVNENRFAILLTQLGVIILYPLFRSQSSAILKIISIVSLPLITFLILTTGSRTGLLSYGLTFFVLYFIFYKGFSLGKIVILAILMIVYIFGINFLQETIPYLDRFTVNNVSESGGRHRYNSIVILIREVIPNNILFGVGLGGENTIIALKNYGSDLLPAHNIIVDTLTQIGIIGLGLYYFVFHKIIGLTFRIRKISSSLYLPILLILASFLNGIGETVFFEKFLWNSLSLGLLYVNNIQYNQNVTEKNILLNDIR